MDYNFTIIIPHRNIPLLLERLINSIPIRDDLEIIVVDDHSDADAVGFEQLSFRNRKNLTLLYNQECRGGGFARNQALPVARGKWLIFADSDDFFVNGFDDFLSEYVNSGADVIFFNANSVDSDSFEPSDRVDHLHDFIEEYHKDIKHGELILRYLFTEPWCKMIKRKVIENHAIRFEETSIRNDVKFSYLVGFYAKTIIVDERQLYCVTTRNNSVSRGIGYQASLDELKVFSGWKNFLMTHQIPLDLPKFDYCTYKFTHHLWKDIRLFLIEYGKMREGGLSHIYIISLIIKNIWFSICLNINKCKNSCSK